MKKLVMTLAGAAALCLTAGKISAQVTIGPEDEKRAEELVGLMTLDEKIGMIGAERSFYLRGVERLGIPAVRLADGLISAMIISM